MNLNGNQLETVFPSLFSPFRLGRLQMKNRLVALPVHTGFAHPDGSVSSWMIDLYARLADSGVSMVVVANASVANDGVVSKFNLRADRDEFIPGLANLARAIKEKGALACLQLNHAGRLAKAERPLLPSPIGSSNLSFNLESLKAFMEFFPFEQRFNLTRFFLNQIKSWRYSMDDTERDRVIDDFGNAAVRAYQAGFDMVELHGANGYLLCQYLSPFTNKIQTGFGGDFIERAAFPLSVIKAIKNRLPANFPLGFRIILREWVPGGIDLPEAIALARLLKANGIAYLSASTGTFNSIFSPDVLVKTGKAGYLQEDSAELKAAVAMPTIISGRITTPALADKLIRDGTADLIGLGRPLRTDPGWIKKAQRPDPRIITCTNCNWCLKRVILEQGFSCIRWPRIFREKNDLEHKLLTRNYKALWLIAGIEDMEKFKNSVPLLDQGTIKPPLPPILFIREDNQRADQQYYQDHNLESHQENFIQWAQDTFDTKGSTQLPLNCTIKTSNPNWEDEIHDKIIHDNHGQIFMGLDKNQTWRNRMLYKERGRMMALLGSNKLWNRVIVPVDLSDATLLVMMFLQKTYMRNETFSFSFVHVLTGSPGPVKRRWKKIKKIVGIARDIPLEILDLETDVVSALVKAIQTGEYGTVIMGKRGLAGMKRWLLGSVSSGVLKHMKDQSIFLID